MNNLYGKAMTEKLPLCDYKFKGYYSTLESCEKLVNEYNNNSQYGYIIDCDIEYPYELHDKHQIPFLPE